MARERTAVQVARYDQDLAAASAEVDRLVAVLLSTPAEVDEPQAVATIGQLLADVDPAELKGLFTAAICMLARLQRQDEAGTGPGVPSYGTD
jgi:hypothetical protein